MSENKQQQAQPVAMIMCDGESYDFMVTVEGQKRIPDTGEFIHLYAEQPAPRAQLIRVAEEAFKNGWENATGYAPKNLAAIVDAIQPQEHDCKFPLCHNEQYQQDLAEQIHREMYSGQPTPVNQQMLAAAKAIRRHLSSSNPGIEREVNQLDEAIAAAEAAQAQQPADGVALDAERYRLLRRGQHWSVIDGLGDILCADDLDEALDAAIAAHKAQDRQP